MFFQREVSRGAIRVELGHGHVGDVVGVESGGIVESGAGVQDEEGAAGTQFNRNIVS